MFTYILGKKLQILQIDDIPKPTGQVSVRDGLIAIPDEKTLHLVKMNIYE